MIKEYRTIRVCLFMADFSRIITEFPIDHRFPNCDFEYYMIKWLNSGGKFIQIKFFESDFSEEVSGEVVVNVDNIVRIKTLEVK